MLIYFCYFVCIVLVILCSLLCISVSRVWSLSVECIHLISTRILVTLITLSQQICKKKYKVQENVYVWPLILNCSSHNSKNQFPFEVWYPVVKYTHSLLHNLLSGLKENAYFWFFFGSLLLNSLSKIIAFRLI